jgi:hypothetical protein
MFYLLKFAKYAAVVGGLDVLFLLAGALDGVSGISAIAWLPLLDKAGLVFLKAALGGAVGILTNMKKTVVEEPAV